MKGAFYNEIDPHAAQWLRNLISAGLIAPGVVEERSIVDLDPKELSEYTQVHLFAGIGGWSLALRLAGWTDDRPVWTGSCPCQPFSTAGRGKGEKDERHLWPEMLRLLRPNKPVTVFGEQVANAVGHGWLDGVSADLEAENYQVGAVVLGAHSVGSPHIRQRLYWLAHAEDERHDRKQAACQSTGRLGLEGCGSACHGLEHFESIGRLERGAEPSGRSFVSGCCEGSSPCSVGNAHGPGFGEQLRPVSASTELTPAELRSDFGFWSKFDLLPCRDGKSRRVEPGSFPLAHGLPGRVGQLRAYGNAIVPQVAAAFIRAYVELKN